MSTPAVWSFAKSSTCFIPWASLAFVTRAPMMFLSPSASFRVFTPSPPFAKIIWQLGLDIFGVTKYNKFGNTKLQEVNTMPDHAKMYALLCAAASEALDALPDTPENAAGRAILQEALLKAEEMYISGTEDEGT